MLGLGMSAISESTLGWDATLATRDELSHRMTTADDPAGNWSMLSKLMRMQLHHMLNGRPVVCQALWWEHGIASVEVYINHLICPPQTGSAANNSTV